VAEVHLEYIGFITQGEQREYTLRLRRPDGPQETFVLAIPLEAFLSRRVRFQDAPDICFRKLQRALIETPEVRPPLVQSVSDTELEDYRQATAPRAPVRRAKPPVPAPSSKPVLPVGRGGWL
jgi:hypothetical protein